MANVDTNNNKLYFDRKNYFLRLIPNDDKLDLIDGNDKLNSTVNPVNRNVRHALEYFVDDLRRDRNKTVERFLSEQTVNEIFRSIAQLLMSNDDRICGNSAYILGSAVEAESGLKRFLAIFSNDRLSNTVDVIRILCHLLTHADSECVLNAAGTLGTICSSKEGRDLILHHLCIAQMVINTSALLSSTNSWIASNAALVLARITVEEIGCQTILTHSKHREILNQLMSALDVSDPSRSTNAAFAIGRLIEGDSGKKTLISDCGQYKLFDALLIMLEVNEEKGVNKNACYALSCLCTTPFGFHLCLQSITTFHRILLAIETILSSIEHETIWFALMCLRTIAQYDGASEHLCYSKNLSEKLKQIRGKWMKYKDIQDEAKLLWYMIHKHVKPNQPKIDVCRTTSADISWELSVHSWDDKELQFRVILDDLPIGTTSKTTYSLKDLKSNTIYSVQIQYLTSHGESVRSDPIIFRTDDELPSPVNNLHVIRATMTAARIAWDPPDFGACNSFTGYQIYLNDAEYDFVNECVVTISSLSASTTYQVDVCVTSSKGKGPRVSCNVITASAGDSIPGPPTFSVIGRREIHIKWQPPEVVSGRLTRYELLRNGDSIYSGTDQEYHASMLKSDTEYIMEVIVFTSEGRFRSRPAKARTLKDEFNNAHRHSLYEPTIAQSPPKLKRTETIHSSHSFGLNSTTSKVALNTTERRLPRDVTIPNRNAEMTSVRSLQLKTENSSTNRLLPGAAKPVQSRLSTTSNTRSLRRPRTDPVAMNQFQSQQRISASLVIPTLDIAREPQVTWATPVAHQTIRTKSFRISAASNPPSISTGSRSMERSASTSLPDLPILQRIHSVTQT